MKKRKSNSFDSDWLRRNSEKEYGLPYDEALELSYDNLRVAYDQLTQQKSEFFAEFERLRERAENAEADIRGWLDVKRNMLAKIDALNGKIKLQERALLEADSRIGNLLAEVDAWKEEIAELKERHAPECQQRQISGVDEHCVDGGNRHYCDRHDDHTGQHRCRCGIRWES